MSTTTMLFCAILCALLVAQASCAEEVSLPRSVKVCNRRSSDYSSCLRLAIQESWLTFVKGIPQLQLPVLDPMSMDYIESNYQAAEISGRFSLRDVKTYGLARTNFLAVRPYFSGNTMNMEIDVEVPKAFIDGNYKADGSIGLYKIGGKGYFNVSIDHISATWSLEGHVDDDRWIIDHLHIYPDVEKLKVHFTDLFNGNDELNKAALSLVNEYWQVFYKGFLPSLEKHWDQYLSDFLNRFIFSKISVSKVFP
ncbi:PREDICTED: circadian clock-controlled protein-like [Ceratosolen solmsi marchali]|uniref:Circadian clock-controlled protein-like n=1 Tax=Ceratosolen solmsi marchali TaxID=326594 RepID=A0AAJ6YII4_9HYME|nr:PREDICTED: circadian clock-controlled protein-like [Ceratosolen solmsi marchali]